MTTTELLLVALVMATVTYLPRLAPFVLLKKKIENRFIKRLLTYLPYAMLAAMVVPEVLFSTSSVWSALAGGAVAVLLSLKGRGLLPVAAAATLTVFIVEQVMVLSGGIV